jgi:putative ABC transport system permease protein
MKMSKIAIKMLIGDKAKYIGIIFGLTFASFIITQQAAIFIGLMLRTCGFITDTSQIDIWVCNPQVSFIDDVQPMKNTDLFRVRSIEGVKWAVPFFKGLIRAKLSNGHFETCNVLGIDEATLIGGPPIMLEGKIEDLRMPDGVIVNKVGADKKLSFDYEVDGVMYNAPLQVGQVLELNYQRAVVVGICQTSRTFQSQPVIYTTYKRATNYAPTEKKLLSFILVKAENPKELNQLCERIYSITGLKAYTKKQMAWLTIGYYMKNTGIPINFGTAVILGFIVGLAIVGQTFYNFTLDNLRYFGTFKAMGADNRTLVRMIILQAIVVGCIGWGLGLGGAASFGFVSAGTELSFRLPVQLLLFSFASMSLICLVSAVVSIQKVRKLEPAIVFKS